MCFHLFHVIEIITAHCCLSDGCILCSQKMLAFISRFYWNRIPAAELERHYLQNGRDEQHTECTCIDKCVRQIMLINDMQRALCEQPWFFQVDQLMSSMGRYFDDGRGFIFSRHALRF